jgi:hypothetical protein
MICKNYKRGLCIRKNNKYLVFCNGNNENCKFWKKLRRYKIKKLLKEI